MNQSLLKVAAIQHACVADKHVNLASSIQAIRDAAAAGAQLIVLPELHGSPYFCISQQTAHFDLAETLSGDTSQALAAIAAELNIVLIGSIFEKRASGLYHNTAIVFDTDGSLAGYYRKMHIPDDPGYNEKFYFTPGDLGFKPIQTSLGNLGVLVCWDQWFPEAARLMALHGADLLIYPTAIGWDPHDNQAEQQRQLDAWQTVQRGHAISNGLPLISCNRVGIETDVYNKQSSHHFWGHSFICGPQGEFLAKSHSQADTLMIDIDMQACENVRRIWPYLRDRRIDAYQDLLKRYGH